jgi:tRNA-splicing ligase RtcB
VEQVSKRFFNWASILEPQAREQAERTASMPFIWPHLALMPDAHHGKGATVGSVIPTLGAIIPAAVGVDIGCGMCAVRTQFTAEDARRIGNLAGLRPAVPVYCRCTPGVAVPFFTSPVSSTTSTAPGSPSCSTT